MIRVTSPSRLHFGLINLGGAESPGLLPFRRFGGVGLMIAAPGVRMAVRPATTWSAEGPLAERALAFARRFAQTLPPDSLRPQHLIVESAPAEHVGLGTGTQLGLCVARALAADAGLQEDAVGLARRIGRGLRSALGIHGFAHGGFLVEAGKAKAESISPLVARAEFPEPWRVVLAVPSWGAGLHGSEEVEAFHDLGGRQDVADVLCRLVLLGLLPALAEGDVEAFGEAAYEFNRRVGEAFAPVQGGVYASPALAELVAFVRRQGVRGVGQSSWGPAVFAVTGDEERAEDLARQIRERFGLGPAEVFVTRAAQRGARVRREEPTVI